MRMRSKPSAFTLIELLIVVAIIGILAAIAIPNFLLAQTRAKVAKVYSEMNLLKTALEMYRTDNNAYALDVDIWDAKKHIVLGYPSEWGTWEQLTTPIAYLSSIFFNPWNFRERGEMLEPYIYGGGPLPSNWPDQHPHVVAQRNLNAAGLFYIIQSPGPDRDGDYWWVESVQDRSVIELDAGRGSWHPLPLP